jgi:hypothetical protein
MVSLSLQLTHDVFSAQPNSFLAVILQLPIPKTRLISIPLLPISCPSRLASRNTTQSSQLNSYLHGFARTTKKTHSLYCWEGVFTASLHSNGCYSIVACVFMPREWVAESLSSNERLFCLRYFGFRASCHNNNDQ